MAKERFPWGLCACVGPEGACPCILERQNYNAEDDLWFDIAHAVAAKILRANGFVRCDFSQIEMYPPFPNRDHQSALGVEFN